MAGKNDATRINKELAARILKVELEKVNRNAALVQVTFIIMLCLTLGLAAFTLIYEKVSLQTGLIILTAGLSIAIGYVKFRQALVEKSVSSSLITKLDLPEDADVRTAIEALLNVEGKSGKK
jgi:divalent metal cation (Fe/Co/Zn/Cd) transporter